MLAAMGYTTAQAGRVLRFSSGWETTEADWAALLTGLEKVSALPDSISPQPPQRGEGRGG